MQPVVSQTAHVAATAQDTVSALVAGLKTQMQAMLQMVERVQRATEASDATEDVVQLAAVSLTQWTGKPEATVVFDSLVDALAVDTFAQAVTGTPDVALVAVTTDGDVLGAFFSGALTGPDVACPDASVFVFSFESHGRCMTPQRFVLKPSAVEHASVRLLPAPGVGVEFLFSERASLLLSDDQTPSTTSSLSEAFDGLEDETLVGANATPFRCSRLIGMHLH